MFAIPSQWQHFEPYLDKVPSQVGAVSYGVVFSHESASFDYLCAVEVSDPSRVPAEFSTSYIPAQQYAVFPHRDHVSRIRETMDAIFGVWLPGSKFSTPPAGPDTVSFFERYGEAFDPASGRGDVEIWLPVVPKS